MKEKAITVSNVSKSFKNLTAVKNLSFTVDKAECFGLLGPNGAGKTTMMKILYGMSTRDKPEHGQIDVFGYDPLNNEINIKYLSGIVQQEDNLDLELSVLQNLLVYSKFYGLSKKKSMPRILELLEFMELIEKKNSKIRELSGGMKRRLSIARALINSPKLLILDEPTTGLDPQVRHIIWDKIRTLKKNGVTVLLTTHYMEEAYQICDKLIIMHRGEKMLWGNPGKLIQEHMEPYVLEIYNEKEDVVKDMEDIRSERTENRHLLYSNNLQKLEEITKNYETGEYFLRQANLEDLFLKITGRALNE